MSSSNPSRFLGDGRELALKMFWGKVIEAFRESTLLWNPSGDTAAHVIAQKDISATGGKSWQFPIMGDDPEAEDHTPGTELLGQVIKLDEGEITIDDIVVSHNDVPLDQTALSHFPVIEPFARKLGRSVALKLDKRAIHTAILAAREAAKAGFHNGGNVVERVGAASLADAYPVSEAGAENFRKDAAELAQLMDDDLVPEEGRYMYITSYIRRVLGAGKDIFNRDFGPNSNVRIRRAIGELEGFNLIVAKGKRIPNSNVTTGPAKYRGDFSRTGPDGEPVALVMCGAQEGEAAIGAVMAGGLRSHMHFDERRNTTFMKAQALMGFGKLSVWCAGEVRVPAA